MVKLKTPEQIETMRQGGKILASILRDVKAKTVVGVSTKELDDLANALCAEHNVIPVFLNYKPQGAARAFPGSICVSINHEIVHGIPNEHPRIVADGDVVSLDMGIKYDGLILDSAVSVIAGNGDAQAKKLLEATERALYAGIDAAKAGNKTGDIGDAVEQAVMPYGFSLPQELGGHGVGESIHEDPFIPNFSKSGEGVVLKDGMVFAIEPMVNEGVPDIKLGKDRFTYETADGKRSAHFEHTVAIVDGKPEILTQL